ncbi:uncharacterized protein LOC144873789 isoform X1 [Branchiostoma floridae x Branchiostoma japonicum]
MCGSRICRMQPTLRRRRCVRRGKKKASLARRKTLGSPQCCANTTLHRVNRQPCLRPRQTICAPANTTQFLMDDRFCYSTDSMSRCAEPCSPPHALNQRIPSPARDPSHIDYVYQSQDEDNRLRETFMEQDFTEVYETFLCSFSQTEFAEELEAFGGHLSHTPSPRRNDEDDSYCPTAEDKEFYVDFMEKNFEDMYEDITLYPVTCA